jgi:5-methylcytosine-specific restriction endonuclease McrA
MAQPLTSPDSRPWRHLYGRSRWKRLRHVQLSEQPLCVYCLTQDIVEVATIVDHRTPHKGDEELFFDPDNLQSLCKRHHDSTKQMEEHGKTVLFIGADGWPI